MINIPDVGTWRDLWDDVPGWVGADGFHGIAHPDGRYLFLCGDTFHRGADGERWATRQSAVVWNGTRLRETHPAGDLIPGLGTSWEWGGPMVWDGPDIWCVSLRSEPISGGWGFRSLPRSLIQLSWPSWTGEPTYIARWDLPRGQVDWGASVARTASWLYIFGVVLPPGGYGHQVYVARVRSNGLPDLSSWEFYTGDRWSGVPDDAAPVLSEHGPSGTFSVQFHAGLFYLTSKMDGDFGTQVSVWVAERVYGPWVRHPIGIAPWRNERMTYGVTAHPDLRTPDGKYVISVPCN